MRQPGLFLVAVVILAWSNLRCGPGQVAESDAGSTTGRTGGSGTGGVAQSTGGGGVVAGTGGAVVGPGSGGAAGGGGNARGTGGTISGTGGTLSATGGAPTATATGGKGGSGGGGGFDDGRLFADAGVAQAASGGSVGSSGGAPGVDAGPMTSTATCAIPSVGLTAVFTQVGRDVTVVVTANNCASGNHVLTIRSGFSCDSAGTQGGIWGGREARDSAPSPAMPRNRECSPTHARVRTQRWPGPWATTIRTPT
jgi:hypothetical protein